MNAFTTPGVEEVVLFTSARVGKTSIIENALGYCIDEDPGPAMMVQPTESDVQEWSKDYLAPLIRDTPCLTNKVHEAKQRTGENTILHKSFPGGYIKGVGAVSPKGFRRTTIRYLFCDEIDAYPPSAGKREGNPLKLAKKRTLTVWNRKMILTSTPTIAGLSNVEYEFSRSNQQHFYLPCIHCGVFQVPIFGPKSQFAHLSKGYLRIDKLNPENSCYICEACGGEWYEADRLRAIHSGEWRALKPEIKKVQGFHLWEFQSPFSSISNIASEWLETREGKDDEKLRVFINVTLGETYVEEHSYTIDESELISRVEDYTDVPKQALVLVGSADVQADRVECQVMGYGKGEESWLIDYTVIPGAPDLESTWERVHMQFQKQYKHASGVMMKVPIRFVDSGNWSHDVYKFVRNHRMYGYYAIKGQGGPRHDFLSKMKRTPRERAPFIVIGVDEGKRTLYDRMRLQAPGPGFPHFNKIADENYFKQLASEKEVVKWEMGRPKKVWMPKDKQIRNEVLDNTVYCLAAFRFLRANMDALEGKMVKDAEAKPVEEVTESAEALAPRRGFVPRRRKGFVTNF